jgi:hypothetical protein
VSEQAMPNLLPILRFQPSKVFSITTESTADRAPKIQGAALKAGCRFDHEPVRLSGMPSISESARAVGRCIQMARTAGLAPLLNFTGGTKLMSIGAFQQAAAERIPSFYVDTRAERLEDGATGPDLLALLGGNNSLSSVTPALNLDVIVAACGHQSISRGRDWTHLVTAADFLLHHPAEASVLKDAIYGTNGLFPNGREPRKPGDWLPFLDATFAVPDELLSQIAPTGVLRITGTGRAALPDSTAGKLRRLAGGEQGYPELYFEAVAPIQQSLSFLTGGWFEVVVAEAMQRSCRFRDIRWSAQVEQQSGAQIEEDLLALDGLEAVCVSCKSSSERARTLLHLEEFQSRAHSIGGRMTKRFLAIHTFKDPKGAVASRARALGIKILTPGALSQPSSFA